MLRTRARLEAFLSLYGARGQQRNFWKLRLSSSFSGAGLPEHCYHPCTSQWMRDPPSHWSGADYVLSAQLRTNTLPTTGALHNARLPAAEKLCRGGCQRVETLSHVLQRCPVTHHPRIARHDHAVSVLAKACNSKGLATQVEPTIRGADGRLRRPDLIVVRDNRVNVVDVSVNWETPQPLSAHYLNKVAIYSDPAFLDEVSRRHPGCEVNVGAIVIGARGTWCSLNDAVIQRLGLDRRISTALVSGVLLGGVLTHRAFGALVWDRRPAPPPRPAQH